MLFLQNIWMLDLMRVMVDDCRWMEWSTTQVALLQAFGSGTVWFFLLNIWNTLQIHPMFASLICLHGPPLISSVSTNSLTFIVSNFVWNCSAYFLDSAGTGYLYYIFMDASLNPTVSFLPPPPIQNNIPSFVWLFVKQLLLLDHPTRCIIGN